MAKERVGTKCDSRLPSLRTFLQPREGYLETSSVEEGGPIQEDTAASRSMACFAASFGIDTRLGVCSFGISPQTSMVTLDLEKLRLSVLACCPEKLTRFNQDCKRFLQERSLGSHLASLTKTDLLNIRSCAEQLHDPVAKGDVPGGVSRPLEATRKAKDIFQTLKAQTQKKNLEDPVKSGGFAWAATLLSDHHEAAYDLPLLLSALIGVEFEEPLTCHVRLGLRPTSQRLRSQAEYAEDSTQVGTAVEEMEFLVGQAYVPRPPPLFLVPFPTGKLGATQTN